MFRIQRHLMGNSALDAEVVQLIRTVFVGEGYTPQAAAAGFERTLLRARGLLWIAIAGDRVVGTVFLVDPASPFRQAAVDDEGEIQLLAVSETNRKAGIGRALLQASAEQAARLGMCGLVLSTQPSMTTAHALYTKTGFRRTPARDWVASDGRTYWVFERAFVSAM